MSRKADFVIVRTTVDSRSGADKLAGQIVRSRLAACVQHMPVSSIYHWKGNIEKAKEFLLLAKTKASLAAELTAFIRKNHSYEVPEIVVTKIAGGLEDYLAWIDRETKSGKK